MKDFDLDDLFETDEQKPQVEPAPVMQAQPVVVTPTVSNQLRSRANMRALGCLGVAGGMLLSMLIGLTIGWFAFRSGSDGIVDPVIDPVSGAYVAIFYQDTDLQQYSSSQREFLNSVNTANWLEEHKVNWKKIDVDDSVDRLEPPFPIMAEKHRSKEPWIVIAAGKKFASEPIESNEQAMKLLQKWVK